MPSIAKLLVGLVYLAVVSIAAPAPAATIESDVAYPGGLPPTLPRQVANVNVDITAPPVPTHFAVFGYSYDGSIVNQSYFANGQPYNKDLWGFMTRPGIDYGNQTYGSYSFGIGPKKHIFAYNDGRIATFNDNDGQTFDVVLLQSWSDWWEYKNSGEPEDKIPTCEIIPFYDVLYCQLDGRDIKFAWCNETVPYGIGYSRLSMGWGYDTGPCTEIVLQTIEVPKGYGDTDPKEACIKGEFPGLDECEDVGANGTAKVQEQQRR